MLYKLAHFLQDKCTWIWRFAEWSNDLLFTFFYKSKLKKVSNFSSRYIGRYRIVEASVNNVSALLKFFEEQPKDALKYFQPHSFDETTLTKLARNRSFLSYLVMQDSIVVGYFFLRCYIIGRCYQGKICDYRWRGKGIGKMMDTLTPKIAGIIGIPVYASINKKNVASLKSVQAVNDVKILKEFSNGDILIQYLPQGERK